MNHLFESIRKNLEAYGREYSPEALEDTYVLLEAVGIMTKALDKILVEVGTSTLTNKIATKALAQVRELENK